MLTAKDIMTKKVITVLPELPVDKLAGILWQNKVSGVPVVDENENLMGVVTESDLIDQTKKVHIPTVVTILDAMIFLEKPSKIDKEIKKMTGTIVKDICTPDPVTVEEGTTIDEIASIMADKHFHTLPVVKDGRVVGVVGKSDIIRTISKP